MVTGVRGRMSFWEPIQNQHLKVNHSGGELVSRSPGHVTQMHKAALWQKLREEAGSRSRKVARMPPLGPGRCLAVCRPRGDPQVRPEYRQEGAQRAQDFGVNSYLGAMAFSSGTLVTGVRISDSTVGSTMDSATSARASRVATGVLL